MKQEDHKKVSPDPEKLENLKTYLVSGYLELQAALNKVHNLALYHSDLPLGKEEKAALYHVNELQQQINQLQ